MQLTENVIKMRYLFRFSIFTAFILLLSGGLIAISHFFLEHNATLALSQAVGHYRILVTIVRYIIYAFIIILWPFIAQKVGARQQWSTATVSYLTHQRIRLLVLFIIIEVFFVYDLFGHLLSWLM